MRLVADETQLWIACGNTIFIADVSNPRAIAFVDHVKVVTYSKPSIGGLVYQNGYIWCSVNSLPESLVIQYNENRECNGIFHLDHSPCSYGIKVEDNLCSRVRNESSEESLSGVGELLDDKKADFVQSLLVVDDTLWVGTVTGDIIVVAISPGGTYGDVLGILRIHPWLGLPSGPVKHMVPCGPDKVVACQMAKTYVREGEPQEAQSQYQLIVWDRWDSNKFFWFRNVQQRLHAVE